MGLRLLKYVVLFGAAQNVTWIILSILAIASYYQKIVPPDDASNFVFALYMRFINPLLQEYYFPNVVVTSSMWQVFMWSYFVINKGIFIAALCSYWDLRHVCYRMHKSLLFFSVYSLFMTLIDLALFLMLCIDYRKTCTGDIDPIINKICKDGAVPFMVIVGKFIVVWLWNLITGLALYRISGTIKSKIAQLTALELQKQTQQTQIDQTKRKQPIKDTILQQNVITVHFWKWGIAVNQ